MHVCLWQWQCLGCGWHWLMTERLWSLNQILYDTEWNCIFTRCSKADKRASLIWCTAPKTAKNGKREKLGSLEEKVWGLANSPWMHSRRGRGHKWNYGRGKNLWNRQVLCWDWKSEKVMGEQWWTKRKIEKLVPQSGWWSDIGSWFQRQGEA